MAPELWKGASNVPTTDIYAATVIFWESLTGKPPFPGGLGSYASSTNPSRWRLTSSYRRCRASSRGAWPRTRRTGRRARGDSSPTLRPERPPPTDRTGSTRAAANSRSALPRCSRCWQAGEAARQTATRLARRKRSTSHCSPPPLRSRWSCWPRSRCRQKSGKAQPSRSSGAASRPGHRDAARWRHPRAPPRPRSRTAVRSPPPNRGRCPTSGSTIGKRVRADLELHRAGQCRSAAGASRPAPRARGGPTSRCSAPPRGPPTRPFTGCCAAPPTA